MKVKAAGYKPLINEGGSTTSEDTLQASMKLASPPVETTSQRKIKPKLLRQKSFEIISDCESTDTSLADVSNIVSEAASEARRRSKNHLSPAKEEADNSENVFVTKKKRPALTIKIQNSSFQDNDDEDFASELDKSPNFCISGKK